jgi:hypothetical protein
MGRSLIGPIYINGNESLSSGRLPFIIHAIYTQMRDSFSPLFGGIQVLGLIGRDGVQCLIKLWLIAFRRPLGGCYS